MSDPVDFMSLIDWLFSCLKVTKKICHCQRITQRLRILGRRLTLQKLNFKIQLLVASWLVIGSIPIPLVSDRVGS